MSKYHASDITGMATATLDAYRKNEVTDLTSDVQKYTALSSLMKKSRFAWEGGEQYTFVFQHDDNGSARSTGMFDDDTIVVSDALGTGRIPVRHYTCNYAFDTKESVFNRGKARIVDHIRLRDRAATLSMHKLIENDFWGKPTDSTDEDKLWGIDLAVTYPTTYTARGFVGGNPSGFTSGYAGINHSTYPRWGNYYDVFSTVDFDDLAIKWIRASMTCNFSSPVPYAGARTRGGKAWYTNQDNMVEFDRMIRSQNDDWGYELAAGANGTPLFRRAPINYVPQLDEALTGDTDTRSDMAPYDPIYGIDWSCVKMIFFSSEWMKKTVKNSATKHTVTEVHKDLSVNPAFLDRRPQVLLSKTTE